MREQLWNERTPNNEHYQWFRNLLDIHGLTRLWVHALALKEPGTNKNAKQRSSHLLKRVQAPGVEENLSILEELSDSQVPTDLEAILDHSYPEELLGRLEQTVWVVQAWFLRNIYDKVKSSEKAALLSSLEQASWKAGKTSATTRWPHLPKQEVEDLRQILAYAQNTPFTDYPRARPFLVRRMTSDSIDLELLACAHTIKHIEMHPIADLLCTLHSHWLRGYIFCMNSRTIIEHQVGDSTTATPVRCRQQWSFVDN